MLRIQAGIQVVITFGVRDKVRQEMLFHSNYVYRNKICFGVSCSGGKGPPC